MTVRTGRGPGRTRPAADPSEGRTRWTLVRAGRDAVPPSVRRFMRRARQRRLRAAAPWAAGLAVLLLGGAVAYVVYGTGLLGVRDVRVEGADLVTPDEVRAAAAVPDGRPLARVDLTGVRRRVAALAPVESVTVDRRLPGTVVITVVERTAVAVAPHGKRFVVLDRSGVVFQDLPRRPGHLPLLRVADAGPDDLATRGALSVLDALSPTLRRQLVEITAAGPAEITLKLEQGRTVVWGDASRSGDKSRIATALLAREGDTIDVSAPEVVTVR
ncbi:MAG TPA: FtsQ-type POTRA domain-containing protein [Asanoa sp.]|jgi:cell division protein FtsQ